MRRLILTAALLLVPLSWAGAQTPAQRIQAARQHAAQAGIPVALLDSKVAEGHAKGVPDDRIAMAVERRLTSLQRARGAMGGQQPAPALTAADLSVGADAVEAGVDAGVLGRLARQAAPDRRAVAIAVLTELVREGVASEQALQRVTAALARGPEALRRLPGDTRGNSGNAAARRGPPDVRGPANAAAHGGRANGGGPPASVPAPGDNGRGHGKGRKP
ncbi:MAG TPA: hypothetical protein VLK66_27240 [Longimicrobium sp.]|nr:hypothetical protein [Longimicrobium sp.]